MVHVIRRVYAPYLMQSARLVLIRFKVEYIYGLFISSLIQKPPVDVHDKPKPFIVAAMSEHSGSSVFFILPWEVRFHPVSVEYGSSDAVALVRSKGNIRAAIIRNVTQKLFISLPDRTDKCSGIVWHAKRRVFLTDHVIHYSAVHRAIFIHPDLGSKITVQKAL